MGAMRKQYGSKKGKGVFYASKNKGKISGVDEMTNIEEGLFQRVSKAISKRRRNFIHPSSDHAERVGITKKNIRDRSWEGQKEADDLSKEAEKTKERDIYAGVKGTQHAGGFRPAAYGTDDVRRYEKGESYGPYTSYSPEEEKQIERNKQQRDEDVAHLKDKSRRAEKRSERDANLSRSMNPDEAGETRKKRLKFRNKLRGSVFRRVAGAIKGPSSKGLKINASREYKHIGSLIAEAMNLMKKKGNKKDLASLYPPYDKITRGDVITGRLKGKKKIQEGMQRRIRQRNAIEKRIASGKGSDEDLKRVETLGAQAEKARTRAGRMAASSVFGGSRARSVDAKVRKATGEGAGDRALLNATKEERSRKPELARKREAMKKEYEERKKSEKRK